MPPPPNGLTAFALKALDEEYLSGMPARSTAVAATRTSAMRRAQHERDVVARSYGGGGGGSTTYADEHGGYQGASTPLKYGRGAPTLRSASRSRAVTPRPTTTTAMLRNQRAATPPTPQQRQRQHSASHHDPTHFSSSVYDDGYQPSFKPKTTSISKVMQMRTANSFGGIGMGKKRGASPSNWQLNKNNNGSSAHHLSSHALYDFDAEMAAKAEKLNAAETAKSAEEGAGGSTAKHSSKSILKKRAEGDGRASAVSSVSSFNGIRPTSPPPPSSSKKDANMKRASTFNPNKNEKGGNTSRRMSLGSEVGSQFGGKGNDSFFRPPKSEGADGLLSPASSSKLPLTPATLAAAAAAAAAASASGGGGRSSDFKDEDDEVIRRFGASSGGVHRAQSVRSKQSAASRVSGTNRSTGSNSRRHRDSTIAAVLAAGGNADLTKQLTDNALAAHYYQSLEEYLSEPVADRLFSPRKINNSIVKQNVETYAHQKDAALTFKPTLAPKSIALDKAAEKSLRMTYAKQRRKEMLSPPRTQRLRRANSTISSVWGADSEILAGINAIKPPSESGDRKKVATPLAITRKARTTPRSIGDLFEWQAMKEENAEERAAKEKARREREQAEEDKEIFALREKEYMIALQRYKAKRAKKAAKRRKIADFVAMSSGGAGGGWGGGAADAVSETDARSDMSERFRSMHCPSHVAAESERLIVGMGDRRIDVYDHAQMYGQAKGQEAIQQRLAREAEKARWEKQEAARRERLREERAEAIAQRRDMGMLPDAKYDFAWFRSQILADPAYR